MSAFDVFFRLFPAVRSHWASANRIAKSYQLTPPAADCCEVGSPSAQLNPSPRRIALIKSERNESASAAVARGWRYTFPATTQRTVYVVF
ncbi:hypothetical protein AB0G83_26300 [Streptomyces klenkii]|uniref:hypothetical protein n=1 Tax=Streptomyces klenkii TaxID=1420899 RepID=UPI0033F95608